MERPLRKVLYTGGMHPARTEVLKIGNRVLHVMIMKTSE